MINVQFYLNIQGKAQINAQNQQGLSPLHLAANQGYDKMAEILIENGNWKQENFITWILQYF